MSIDSVREQLQPALLDRYTIERELGRGGMATVYLARDTRHDRLVALKVLNPELGAVLGAERFLSEIRVTANLQHPNLLPLFDSGDANGLLFYVMPFVDGESLRQRLERERQLPVDEAVRIAVAIAGALDYAHRRGVIHRDLKPENVLLHEGQPLVADFGIALAISNAGGQRVTQTGMSLGTPQYMSPEQATGDRVIDGRTDIYSLGAVTYEMLTGEPPHTGATAQAVIARLMTEEPRPLTAIRRTVPAHLEAAVLCALQKLPADRFATGAEFAAALVRDGESRGSRLMSRAHASAAVRRWQIATAATGAVAVAAMTLWATSRSGPVERVRPVRARFTLDLPDSALMARGTRPPVALSPDGSAVVYVGRTPGGALWLRRLDELAPRRIPGTEGGTSPRFSPDGRAIAFTARGSLLRVPVDGGSPTVIVDSLSSGEFAWLDGGTIVFSRADSDGRVSLWRVSDTGGRASPLTTAPKGETHRFPEALPGGKAVLFAIQTGGGRPGLSAFATVRLADGAITRLGIAGTGAKYADGLLVFLKADLTIGAVPFDPDHLRVTGDPLSVMPANGWGDLSENGTLLYYPNAGAVDLMRYDRRGGSQPLFDEKRLYFYPRISPDGRRVAVQIGAPILGGEIWMIDLASGTLTQVTSDRFNTPNGWTPDGRRIIWTRWTDSLALWWQPWDASAPAERLLSGAQGAHFSADGKALLTTIVRPNGGRELRVVPVPIDTSRWSPPLPLPATQFSMPRLSPDGKWIAYVDGQAGVYDVFLYSRTGGRYQVSVGGGVEPVWSPDGKALFYRTPFSVMAAQLELGADARVVRRERLFDVRFANMPGGANYDVTPDGQHLIIPRPIAVSEWPIVVMGWTDEVRERMQRGSTPQ